MKLFNILENDANQRLDKFLKKLFPSATRGLIYKLNRKGKIKVSSKDNSSFAKKDNEYKLAVGDIVKIFLSDDEFNLLSKTELKNDLKLSENKKLSREDIVYEDSDLLIINKNPGLNVHPGDHKTKEVSLIEQVQDYFGEKLDSLTFKPSLVHRIDRDTSGIIIIAKKKDILTKLSNDLKKGDKSKIQKTYLAYLFGKMPKKSGTINDKIIRIEDAKNENKVQISENGLDAITHYKVISENILKTKTEDIIISEVEFVIETGRMHQIRVHTSNLGNPIVGDDKYGNKKLNFYISKTFGFNRQALHSYKLEIFHYSKGKKVNFIARIKKDMNDFINKIKSS